MNKHSDFIRQQADILLRQKDKAGSEALRKTADQVAKREEQATAVFPGIVDVRPDLKDIAERLSSESRKDSETLLIASREITRLRTILIESGINPDWEHISQSGRRLEPPKKNIPF